MADARPATSVRTARSHNSCDRCRSRKTKCIDPVPGPCRYCARTGATCTIATPRKKRPYYHVTEEEYQCSMRILQHFFPDRELNLESLRTIVKAISDGSLAASPVQNADRLFVQNQKAPEDEESPQDTEAQDVDDLHESLGCMMRDSRGKFRYVGNHSDIPFNGAVGTLGNRTRNPAIIASPKLGLYPPALSVSSPSTDAGGEMSYYLPARALCDHYVSRFLEDVHCTYWLYPVESLLRRVDQTYLGTAPTSATSSWMCSLYAIFAIGASRHTDSNVYSPQSNLNTSLDLKTSAEYLNLAKELVPAVYDEADIDSIRALAILSVLLENMCSRISSYLYIGASIQMAYSLGLHRDQTESGTAMERERNRRIWWTLFMLDQEIASRNGSPTIIDERNMRITTLTPSEQILYPGLHTPLSWLPTLLSMCHLKREIIQALYTERSAKTISFSTVSEFLLSLRKWYHQMPAHLNHNNLLPPTHRRAVAVLHLHYWSTTILLTRPFLLYLVIKHSTIISSKKTWFDRMGKTCIDAAEKSLAILQQMATDGTLSSLTASDSTCILRLVMIFLLAYAHTRVHMYRVYIDNCMALCRNMEQIGFTNMVTEETAVRLADMGIITTVTRAPNVNENEDGNENATADVHLDDELVAQIWHDFDPNYMNSLQLQQSLDVTFDDLGAFDVSSDLWSL
ncbi:hypothetical protein P153DRAFT_29783 [Dothidotthia symphoricarpi CBS 119687]|uniref:Zn(2)-C6 fungal-type domain-containing protein n=1 Tax=Dothidotthia symphoricarpi CBS 119687 TaxID=1392245 RepID=A0A6A6ADJ6_9PLEO|nr:uncharacterized protein P153DRAFT_29783 [Dothidotthia symphoricarpi CBS 119687]KAF2129008.1 hypothetical protein P153DRAFT_29783 [Dothidotthia symphoricarpi CBS 119687]